MCSFPRVDAGCVRRVLHLFKPRRLLLILASSIMLLAGVGTTTAGAAALPKEGVFEGCSLDTQMPTCLQRLHTIHQGGVQVVVFSPLRAGSSSRLR